MIRPNKHSHPDRTLISATVVLLKRLRRKRTETFDELRNCLAKSKASEAFFLPAMNLLFMLGLVEYRKKNDTFEYIGR
ncbi:ABC-three component system middle component 8 [Gimesia maris]|uniref:ABC-three component system middle component 8 n=1 Tax=Gimesia maris TaxID=122 RepID=UPI003C6D5AC3